MPKIKNTFSATQDALIENESSVSTSFKKFFKEEIRDIYWAEKHLWRALPKMKKAASSKTLINIFSDHVSATLKHITRLENVFEELGEPARQIKCEAMAGLVQEANNIIERTQPGTHIRDAGLIIAAQKIEHYEIATYGGLTQWSITMKSDKITSLLQQTLAEEIEANDLLTALANDSINNAAVAEGKNEENNIEGLPAKHFDSVNLEQDK